MRSIQRSCLSPIRLSWCENYNPAINSPPRPGVVRHYRGRQRRALFVIILAQHFAGLGINEMDARADRAGYGIIAVLVALCRIVGNPALDAKTRSGATE